MTVAALGSVPPVAASAMPADVRRGGPEAQDAYRTALAFEQVLVQQLAERMAATATPDEDDASAATSAYRDLLPQALADAVTASGGLGLADSLYRATFGGPS